MSVHKEVAKQGWVLGAAGVAAILVLRSLTAHPPASLPAPAAPAAAVSMLPAAAAAALRGGTREPAAAGSVQSFEPYIRLYEEYFGLSAPNDAPLPLLRGSWGEVPVEIDAPQPAGKAGPHDVARVVQAAARASYQLKFLVALVPDAVESGLMVNYDLTMSGLMRGMAKSSFVLNRKWQPRPSADKDDRPARRTPALLLFRRPVSQGAALLAVLVVGETPRGGIHQQAFQQAIRFIEMMRGAEERERASLMRGSRARGANKRCGKDSQPASPAIDILGPSFSGSADSLRLAMAADSPQAFRVVSGTATAPDLAAALGKGPCPPTNGGRGSPCPHVTMGRTVTPDDTMILEALTLLQWNLGSVALLVDGDALGRLSRQGPLSRVTRINFPSGIGAMRNAWDGGDREDREVTAGRLAGAGAGTAEAQSDLSLAGPLAEEDVAELSAFSVRNHEVTLRESLYLLARFGIHYVGILATDVRDQLFLAEQVHRWHPAAVVFIVQGNLMYLHPRLNADLFGSLSFSSYMPSPVLRKVGSGGIPTVESSAGDNEEGIQRAVECLLGRQVGPPEVWISAVGQNRLSPIAKWTAPLASGICSFVSPVRQVGSPSPDSYLLLLVCIVCLALAAVLLSRWWPLRGTGDLPASGAGRHGVMTAAWLVLLGLALLIWSAAALIALWLPLRADASRDLPAGAVPPLSRLLVLGGLCCLLVAVAAVYRCCRIIVQPGAGVTSRAAALGAAVAVVLIPALLLWNHDALGAYDEYFLLRVRGIDNGLSPVVTFALLVAALFTWVRMEMMRQLVRARHGLTFPLPLAQEPALSAGEGPLTWIQIHLRRTLPPHHIWLFVLAILAARYLMRRIQPVIEPPILDDLFIGLLLLVLTLCAVSFVRFMVVWLTLSRILERLQFCRFRPGFAEIAELVQWNPMKSFVWYLPNFKSLAQSVGHLELLENSGVSEIQADAKNAREQLAKALKAEMQADFLTEVKARRDCTDSLYKVCATLIKRPEDFDIPAVRQLLALRIVAYLRMVHGQLRYALMGAMCPAGLALLSVYAFSFVPRPFVLTACWCLILIASAISCGIFVFMDRDVVLSEIGQTTPGQVTLNRTFLSNLFAYALLPVLSLVLSVIPGTGALLTRLLSLTLTGLVGGG